MATITLTGPVPGPRSAALLERRKRAVMNGVGTLHPIFVERASGATVTDVDGNTFIDFTGGIGVMNAGHADPAVTRAIAEQAARFTHVCFQVMGYDGYVEVAEALARITPGSFEKRALLVSTGAEAVENAVKIARGATKRSAVLCFEHGFHGRTLLALTLTGKAAPYKPGFGPFAPEIYRLPFPYTYRGQGVDGPIEQALKTVVSPTDLAAIIIEPVLGEGGFVVPPPAFLHELRALADAHGIVFIIDEVQSGFGRTGKMFAIEHVGIEPDLMTLAKSMGAGTPLAAVVGRASLMDTIQPGGVGGTYGGNPVACAAALATIELLEGGLIENAATRGDQAQAGLRPLIERYDGLVRDVRGKGLMLGIEFDTADHAEEVQWACFERGLLVLECGKSSVRMSPALTVSEAEMTTALRIFGEAVDDVANRGGAIAREATLAGAMHDGEVGG